MAISSVPERARNRRGLCPYAYDLTRASNLGSSKPRDRNLRMAEGYAKKLAADANARLARFDRRPTRYAQRFLSGLYLRRQALIYLYSL